MTNNDVTFCNFLNWCICNQKERSSIRSVLNFNSDIKSKQRSYWRIKAILQNGEEITYTLKNFPFERIEKIITTAEDEDIFLQIFRVKENEEVKLFDSLFLQCIAKAESWSLRGY